MDNPFDFDESASSDQPIDQATQSWFDRAQGTETYAPGSLSYQHQGGNFSPGYSFGDNEQSQQQPVSYAPQQPSLAPAPQSLRPVDPQQQPAWMPAAQNLKQPAQPASFTPTPSGTSPINQQATLGMVDYLKQNLGKTPADSNIKSDLDNVSRMVKSGTAYQNWPYCAGILYAAAQKAGVSTDVLGGIKSPLAASAWQLGQRQQTPSVGNFAYWPHGHISMVSAYDPDKNMVRLIGGNQGARTGQYRPISETGWVPTNYSGVRYYRGYKKGGGVPFASHAQSTFHNRLGIR